MDYLIVGLGNPGTKYEHTRHNIGFDVLETWALKHGFSFSIQTYAETASGNINGKKVLAIKPQTFMNLSGKALLYWKQWYKIPQENILVVVDDIALPVGKLRMRPAGSSAGHNGLKDIEKVLGGQAYARLKFGVGNDFPAGRQSDFVLGKFNPNDQATVKLKIDKAIQMIDSFIEIGVPKTMTAFNE
jgi:PTH1 family peptidyl-tRNA hydrolase